MKRQQLAAVVISASFFLAAPYASAHAQTPQVSVATLKVVENQYDSQSVITPKGDLAFLPGKGVKGDVAKIYMGSQGGLWYEARTDQWSRF